MGNQKAVVGGDDGVGVEVVEHPGFVARESVSLNHHQPPPRPPPPGAVLVAASMHSRAQGIHVVQCFGHFMAIFHVLCAADQLAEHPVGFGPLKDGLQPPLGSILGEPDHLKGTVVAPCKQQPEEPLDGVELQHVEFADQRREGLLCSCVGEASLRQHSTTSCRSLRCLIWWYTRSLSPFSRGYGMREVSTSHFMPSPVG